jgi:hypothetical protein
MLRVILGERRYGDESERGGAGEETIGHKWSFH